jgi:molecular chaperone DnaK
MEKLTQVSYKIAEAMYAEAAKRQQAQQKNQSATQSTEEKKQEKKGEKDDVIDADYKVVDEDEEKKREK